MISCSQQELRSRCAGDEGSYNRHNAQPAVTAGAVFVCPSSSSDRTGDWMLSKPDLGHGWQWERGGEAGGFSLIFILIDLENIE